MRYIIRYAEEGHQAGDEDNFVGGKPKLPADVVIPACGLCGASQTFFFQIAFPADQEWAGLSLAVFQCTNCASQDHLIPAMLPGFLKGGNIPLNFLIEYQKNFRFLVFATEEAVLRDCYRERIAFRPLDFDGDGKARGIGFVGGEPEWILEDESPSSYNTVIPMRFLLQIEGGVEFQTVSDAPRQIELDLTGKPLPSESPFYQLLIGNAIYLFGTADQRNPLVYAITQVL